MPSWNVQISDDAIWTLQCWHYVSASHGCCNVRVAFSGLSGVSGRRYSFSEMMGQHLEWLETILKRMHSAGLKLKPEKCMLFHKSVSFLGHVVSKNGIDWSRESQNSCRMACTKIFLRIVHFLGISRVLQALCERFCFVSCPYVCFA